MEIYSMSLTVTCNLCANLIPPRETILRSKIISRNTTEDVMNVGNEMQIHMVNSHPMEWKTGVVEASAKFTGLMVMKYFDSEDKVYEGDKEKMRDMMAELVMYGAPDDDDYEDEDDDEVDELLEGDDEDEDEDDDELNDEDDEDCDDDEETELEEL